MNDFSRQLTKYLSIKLKKKKNTKRILKKIALTLLELLDKGIGEVIPKVIAGMYVKEVFRGIAERISKIIVEKENAPKELPK